MTAAHLAFAIHLFATPVAAADVDAVALIRDYLGAVAKVRDATYTLTKTERMRTGKKLTETLKIKLRVKPYAVYLIRLAPGAGMEAVFRQGKNDNQMRAHPGSFPDITVNLDPEGGMAMKNQHAPIYLTGMTSATQRMQRALALAAAGKVDIQMTTNQRIAGKSYPCVEIDATRLDGSKIEARQDETLFDVARRTGSAPFLLYRYNRIVDDLTDELDAGTTLFLPGYYAKRTHYCFDPATHLFVRETYFDDNGLWERYDSVGRKTNVGLSARDFDPDNPAYDF